MKRFVIITMALAVLSFNVSLASANVTLYLTEEFQSGALFTGYLTFTDTYDNLLAVNGTLTGSAYVSGSDPITWLWWTTVDRGSGIYDNYLMNGTNASDYTQFIEINWSYLGDGVLVLRNDVESITGGGAPANAINYTDPVVNYSFTAVPIPAAVWLLGTGLLGLCGIRRKLEG